VPAKKLLVTDAEIRQQLIAAGVKNLVEYGFPGVMAENILTHQVYQPFFDSMLEETARDARRHGRYIIERAVTALRQEIAHVPEKVRNRRRKDRRG